MKVHIVTHAGGIQCLSASLTKTEVHGPAVRLAHPFDVGRPHRVIHSERREQSGHKCRLVLDDLCPVMLSFFVGKHLAPLENGDIREVSIRQNPKLLIRPWLSHLKPRPIVGEVSQCVTTHRANTTQALPPALSAKDSLHCLARQQFKYVVACIHAA